jgi:hypothetical protein
MNWQWPDIITSAIVLLRWVVTIASRNGKHNLHNLHNLHNIITFLSPKGNQAEIRVCHTHLFPNSFHIKLIVAN